MFPNLATDFSNTGSISFAVFARQQNSFFFSFSPPQQKVHCSSAESLTKLNPQQQYPTCVINTIKTAGAALTKLADIRKKLSLHPVRYISGAHHVLFISETLTVSGCQVTKRPSYIYLKADMYPES